MKFELLSKEDQIKELAECYSDYRAIKKEISQLGGLLKASDSLLDDLYWEAACLRYRQKEMGIELVLEKDLNRDVKVFLRKAELIQQIKEEKANAA
jgi:hypothetical protein